MPIDLTSQRFDRWIVVRRASPLGAKKPTWLCRCDCGATGIVQAGSLRGGHSKSCGCLQRDWARQRFRKHGAHTAALRNGTKEYRAWKDMKARCLNPDHRWYHAYGGKGVAICQAWRDDFRAFLHDLGPAPAGYSLDRINPAGHYEPGNCRWTDRYTQATNTRRGTLFITLKSGARISAKQFAQREHVDPKAIYRRLKLGESPEEALGHIKAQRPNRWKHTG